MKALTDLTPLQLRLLEVLWDRGEASAREVWEIAGEDLRLSRKTIGTLLTRLQQQRMLRHRKVGREFLFSARVTREAVQAASVSGVLFNVFNGDLPLLIAQALSAGDVADGDVERVHRMLDDWQRRQEA